jgi:hypothetical protein
MCHYCELDDHDILNDIQNTSIPSEVLVESCSWRRICQVRGRNFYAVDDDVWSQICKERGYLFSRSNSRGF